MKVVIRGFGERLRAASEVAIVFELKYSRRNSNKGNELSFGNHRTGLRFLVTE